jgi:hypothetical protein
MGTSIELEKNEVSFGYCAKELVIGGWVRFRSSELHATELISISLERLERLEARHNRICTTSTPRRASVLGSVSTLRDILRGLASTARQSHNLDQHLPLDSPAPNFKI